MPVLYIGNRNYSSWSLRAWLLLKAFGIPFEERYVPVTGRGVNPALKPVSASGRVPCLHLDDGFQVWDSLAIAETLAERHPRMWPQDPRARARARSVSAEMHAGFAALRSALPMNLKYRRLGGELAPDVRDDISRIVGIWHDARENFAGDRGPWLFGEFSIADAMYAPVAWRFHIYDVPLPPVAAAWRDAVLAHPAVAEWHAAALAETDVIEDCDRYVEGWGEPR